MTLSEAREKNMHHLQVLLKLKKANPNITVNRLQDDIENAVIIMAQEDVAWVEKIVGIKAL